tara:strand:- start:396 stop:830 length:435 start_codon:yes stop_codon:yes gene_type:complete
MRDKIWLEKRFDEIWKNYFSDIEKKNQVNIMFKGKSKYRFGYIKGNPDGSTLIAINSLFAHDEVPEWIINLTLAHELVHYTHGFHSPHPRLFKHPHKGGIVNRELKERGFQHELKKEKIWFKEFWVGNQNRVKKELATEQLNLN